MSANKKAPIYIRDGNILEGEDATMAMIQRDIENLIKELPPPSIQRTLKQPSNVTNSEAQQEVQDLSSGKNRHEQLSDSKTQETSVNVNNQPASQVTLQPEMPIPNIS